MMLTTNGAVIRIVDAFDGKPLYTLAGYQNNKVSLLINLWWLLFLCTPKNTLNLKGTIGSISSDLPIIEGKFTVKISKVTFQKRQKFKFTFENRF